MMTLRSVAVRPVQWVAIMMAIGLGVGAALAIAMNWPLLLVGCVLLSMAMVVVSARPASARVRVAAFPRHAVEQMKVTAPTGESQQAIIVHLPHADDALQLVLTRQGYALVDDDGIIRHRLS